MSNHSGKYVAPIVVTVIMIIYYVVYFAFILHFIKGFFGILLGVIPVLLCAGSVYVLIQRIKEIRSGEEDDLGKY